MKTPGSEATFIFRQLCIQIADESIEHGVAWSNLKFMRFIETTFTDRNPVNAKFELNFVRPKDEREVDGFTPDVIAMIRDRTQKTYDAARERLR
jgi:hypothetical protein